MNRWWYEGKAEFLELLSLDRDISHVHLGLFLFFFFLYFFRKFRHGVWFAFGLLLMAQTVNEGLDALDWIGWTGNVNWIETISDTLHTLFWPLMLSIFFSLRLNKPLGLEQKSSVSPTDSDKQNSRANE